MTVLVSDWWQSKTLRDWRFFGFFRDSSSLVLDSWLGKIFKKLRFFAANLKYMNDKEFSWFIPDNVGLRLVIIQGIKILCFFWTNEKIFQTRDFQDLFLTLLVSDSSLGKAQHWDTVAFFDKLKYISDGIFKIYSWQ